MFGLNRNSQVQQKDKVGFFYILTILVLFVVNVVFANIALCMLTAKPGTSSMEIVKSATGYNFLNGRCKPGQIKGILWNETEPKVLITDKIYTENEKIGEVEILHINPESVEFIKNGQVWEQKVGEKPSPNWE